jgi:segregation and condensation protein B
VSEQELSQTADDQAMSVEEAGEENADAAIGESGADSMDETVVVEGESTIVESAPEAEVAAVTADSDVVANAADLDSEEADGTDESDVLDDGLGAPTLSSALEALLLVTEQPMQAAELAALVRCPESDVVQVLELLAADYTEAGRGFDLRHVAGGWRFYTRGDCAEVVERFVRDGQQSRLSQAALETLAVIAYRQPVARSRIAAIRGVSVDGVIRTLTSRGLIVESGQEAGTGALLYQTTDLFLDRLGISSLDELPPVMDYLPNLDTLEDFLDQTSS